MMSRQNIRAHRASILHFYGDPDVINPTDSYQYISDGLLLVDNDRVSGVGDAEEMLRKLPEDVPVSTHDNCLIMPGFVDTHIHYPQTEMIAAYGERLLEWLEKYTFPVESQFADLEYARSIAEVFLDELLRSGTTTALVFGTVHKESVDAFFDVCEARNLRMIAGKVMMDRNAPEFLTDTPQSAYLESKSLIEKWHGRARLQYAITPRFAITSTHEQLEKAGQLLEEFPSVYMHTHLSENTDEVEFVKELFPERSDYLDVYNHAGLLGRRSVFAHCLHLTDREWSQLGKTQSGIAFCPTSNLFLGSGLFNLDSASQNKINVGIGSDIGAGTSFSILQSLNEAYKVMQLQGKQLSALKSFYLATLGGAVTLDIANHVGNFEIGKEADFVVVDKFSTPLMQFRMKHCKDLMEQLFVLSMMGDDRAIKQTWSGGRLLHERDKRQS